MTKKDEIRRDFRGTMTQFGSSLNKGFYRAFDENNEKVQRQVLHEENIAIFKMLCHMIEYSGNTELMEALMRKEA